MTDEEEWQITYPDLEPFLAGIVERFGQPPIRCYDLEKVIASYQQQGMTEEEAWEYWHVNVIGAWVGPTTPCFIRPPTEEEQVHAADADL